MEQIDKKYKDASPLVTIENIKKKLEDYDISISTVSRVNPVKNIYFTHVNIECSELLYTNGKGTSIEYALASGYSEALERLQNQFIGKNYSVDREVENYLGFKLSKDEKIVSIDEAKLLIKKIYKDDKEDAESFFVKLIQFIIEMYDYIYTVPYYNLKSRELVYVPIGVSEFLYGSNGLCAGNTIEEALVQGISELIERHISQKIIEEGIIPPTIDKKDLICSNELLDSIECIESKGIKLIFKDCSVMNSLPGLGLIAIDSNSKSYIIKFSSHPCIEIAIERLITELMQGKNINDFKGMVEIAGRGKMNATKNKMSTFINGTGYYPDLLFSNMFSYNFYNFNNFYKGERKDNKYLLNYLINIIHNLDYEILIRDVSFLGFNSYSIIIPGFSEIFNTLEDIDYYIKYKTTKKFIKDIPNLTKVQSEYIYDFLSENYSDDDYNVYNLLDIPIKTREFKTDINYFLCMLALKINKTNFALNHLNKFIESKGLHLCNLEREVLNCFYLLSKLKDNNYNDLTIRSILLNFFNIEIVVEASKIEYENYFETYFNFQQCWECEKCDRKDCDYQKLKSLKLKLKKAMNSNYVNQDELIIKIS